MINLNTSANGKPRNFVVKVTRTYYVHTCDENPQEAIEEMVNDHTCDEFTEDEDVIINIEELNK